MLCILHNFFNEGYQVMANDEIRLLQSHLIDWYDGDTQIQYGNIA